MKLMILLAPLMISFGCFAQSSGDKRVGVAYFGELIGHPGISLSYESDFLSFGDKITNDLVLPKSKTLFYGAELGTFHHERALNAVFSQIRFGFRKEGRKGGFWSFDLGNGYFMGSIPNTFSLDDGVVSKTRSIHHYTMHSINFSYGRSLKWLDGTKWFIAPTFYITRPAFPNYTAHAALRIGLKKKLK